MPTRSVQIAAGSIATPGQGPMVTVPPESTMLVKSATFMNVSGVVAGAQLWLVLGPAGSFNILATSMQPSTGSTHDVWMVLEPGNGLFVWSNYGGPVNYLISGAMLPGVGVAPRTRPSVGVLPRHFEVE